MNGSAENSAHEQEQAEEAEQVAHPCELKADDALKEHVLRNVWSTRTPKLRQL